MDGFATRQEFQRDVETIGLMKNSKGVGAQCNRYAPLLRFRKQQLVRAKIYASRCDAEAK